MKPYELSDKTISLLNKKAVKRFNKAKTECAILNFDELNVINAIKSLYANLESDNQKAFLELSQAVYADINRKKGEEPDLTWLLALLDSYDPVTKYVYSHEVDRKRDYTAEAVIASKNKPSAFKKGLSLWSKMTAYYADDVEWQSTLKAFKDAGVKYVMWHTEEDDRVCEECEPLDKKVFAIDKVPPKQHWGCRCVLQPLIR